MNLNYSSEDGITRLFIDATSLKTSACLRKIFWTVVEGWRTPNTETSPAIGYGHVMHKFWERYYTGVDNTINLDKTRLEYTPYHERLLTNSHDNEFRTGGHLLKSCQKYIEQYPRPHDGIKALTHNGQPLVEQQFAFPFWQSKDKKFEIIICGTIDITGAYINDKAIIDHKTTTTMVTRKEGYFEDFEFDIQVLMYSWAFEKIVKDGVYLPVLINAAFIKNPTLKAEKAGVFDGVEFHRSKLIEITEDKIVDFERFLNFRIGQISYFIEENRLSDMRNYFDMSLCKNYGKCKYFTVCKNRSKLQESILKTYFEQKRYEPLKFRD